jgi:hypothetical protein
MPGQPSIMLPTSKAVWLPMTGGSADITPPYGSEAAPDRTSGARANSASGLCGPGRIGPAG